MYTASGYAEVGGVKKSVFFIGFTREELERVMTCEGTQSIMLQLPGLEGTELVVFAGEDSDDLYMRVQALIQDTQHN